MNRKILIQAAAPAVIIGGLLCAVCLVSAWYINRLQAEMSQSKDMLQSDIDTKIANGKKMFLPGYLMGGILSYLSIGALISVIGAGFLSQAGNSTNK